MCSRGRAPRDRPVVTPDSLRAHRASRSLRSGSWHNVRPPLIVRDPPSRRLAEPRQRARKRAQPVPSAPASYSSPNRPLAEPKRRSRHTGPPRPAQAGSARRVGSVSATCARGGGAGVAQTCAAATRCGRWCARRLDRGRARCHGRWPCGSRLPYIERPATGHTPPYGKRASLAPALRGPGFRLRSSVKLCVVPPASISNPSAPASSPAAPCTYARRTLSPPALPCEQRQPGLLNDCTTILATSRP